MSNPYKAHILALAEELAGFCDIYGVKHPSIDRIAAAFHYAELNGVLTIDEIRPSFREICDSCTRYGISIPQVLSLLIAGSLSGWNADVALRYLGWTADRARPDLAAAVIANHPEIMVQTLEHVPPLMQILSENEPLPEGVTSYLQALNNCEVTK